MPTRIGLGRSDAWRIESDDPELYSFFSTNLRIIGLYDDDTETFTLLPSKTTRGSKWHMPPSKEGVATLSIAETSWDLSPDSEDEPSPFRITEAPYQVNHVDGKVIFYLDELTMKPPRRSKGPGRTSPTSPSPVAARPSRPNDLVTLRRLLDELNELINELDLAPVVDATGRVRVQL